MLFRGGAPRPSTDADDDLYTDDEKAPISTIGRGEQIGIAFACLVVVVWFIVLACCLAKSHCAWHAPLVALAEKVENKDGAALRAERARSLRAARAAGEASPLLAGAWASLAALVPASLCRAGSEAALLQRQCYLVVWKALAVKRRETTTLATFFAYPLCVWCLMWLLYATFSHKRSSGAMEQYLGVISLVFVLQGTAASLAADKAAKLRESTRAMGLRDAAAWAGPLLVDGLLCSVALGFALAVVVAPAGLMHNCGRGYGASPRLDGAEFATAWGFFTAACLALVAVSCALSTVCDSAPGASQLAFGVVIASVVAFVVVKDTKPKALEEPYTDAWLLLPTTALQVAILSASSTMAKYPATVRASLAHVTKWLFLDVGLWGVLAWYLGEVLPSEFGTTRPWYFPVTSLYKCVARAPRDSEPSRDDYVALEGGDDGAVTFRGLNKTFGSFKAVQDAALALKHGELTALLGHNGAGKTTLLRLLTGLTTPDGGDAAARAYGVDLLSREAGGTSALLGVVPQHDVLWEKLTVREHAHFCAVLKSNAYEPSCADADALLETFHLGERLGHFGGELSGGMRRKLSTACALAGGSRFVVLDEPTTGLDPLARKELWDVLEQEKAERTLLLTTHYMDEADVLGDVVAIMVAGRLKCADAPEALKAAYGSGRKLVVEAARGARGARDALDAESKRGESPARSESEEDHVQLRPSKTASDVSDDNGGVAAAVEAILAKHAPGARAWERRYDEAGSARAPTRVISRTAPKLEFAVPRDRGLADCLEALESSDAALRIGVSDTDMEDVFLRVGDDAERDRAAGPAPAAPARASSAAPPPAAAGGDGSCRVVARQTAAMVRKRLRVAAHDPFRTLLLVALPVGAAVAAFSCNATDKFGPRGTFAANMTTCVFCMLGFVPMVGLLSEHVAGERSSKLRNVLTVAGCDARAYWAGTLLGDLALLVVVGLCFSTVATGAAVWGGSAPAKPSAFSLRYTLDEHVSAAVAATPEAVLMMGAAEAAPRVPESLRRSLVDDAVHVDDDAWLGDDALVHAVLDAVVRKYDDPTLGAVLDEVGHHLDDDAALAFDVDGPGAGHKDGLHKWLKVETWVYPILFLAQASAFSYAASFGSGGPRTAVVLGPMLVLGLLFAPASALALVNLTLGEQGADVIHLSKDAFLGVLFWGAALCCPHGGFVLEMARVSTKLAQFADGYPPRVATFVIAIVEMVLFLYVAYRLDDRAAALAVPFVDERLDDEDAEALDGDVRFERAGALAAARGDHALTLRGVRKVYGDARKKRETVAVENLSLRVDAGEIFGLLGANGAGKTSAIAVVMRAAFPTAGDAWVCGRSILDDFRAAAAHLGVVTQTDTLYDKLSCREHLDLFLDLRTARQSVASGAARKAVVDAFLDDVELAHVPDRLASRLSGGMKRKLCVACALVGDPDVVLLDEPSAGLDPVSRRRLWTVLRRAMVGRAVVLTTHSMEEAEALCTRVAIMAHGQLRALGTPLSLKAKFGAAWTLSLRTGGELSPDDAAAAKRRVLDLVPGAAPRADRKKRVLELDVPDVDGRVGATFRALENDLADGGRLKALGVADFSLEQPKLEDVFLAVVASADATKVRVVVDEEAAPVCHPAADGGGDGDDAPGAALTRCCFGLDRRAHKCLAVLCSFAALALFFSMSGLMGGASYDDDNRDYGDDARAARGCHHEKGAQSPCSVDAVYLNGIPFFVALVAACTGCCGCCCCIKKNADAAMATA